MLNKIIDIVNDASKLMQADFSVRQKDGYANIVTSADVAVQNYLVTKLSELLPDSGFILEEGDINYNTKEYTWIIDPIDGTCNFARGLGQSAISVALQHNGELKYGVVYNPYTDEMYYAEAGKGAFCNGKRLSVSAQPFCNALLFSAMSVYHKQYAKVCADIIYEIQMKCNDIRRFGTCALELCLIAAGKSDLFFEICVQPWDYAAAQLVLQEAGGIVTTVNGQKLRRDKPVTIIGANNLENHTALLEIVDRHLKQNNIKI